MDTTCLKAYLATRVTPVCQLSYNKKREGSVIIMPKQLVRHRVYNTKVLL